MLDNLRQHFHRLTASCLAAALPQPCALCGGGGAEGICEACRLSFFGSRPARCHRCADTIPSAHAGMQPDVHVICGDCLKREPAFDATIVAANYAAPVDQLVLSLKFGSNLALAPLFARMLTDAMLERREHAPMPDVLTAVPLGPQRLVERGFNQALEIARPLSRRLGIDLEPRLAVRVRDTGEQARLSPKERLKNVRGAFTVLPHMTERIRGRHVGIVDDVITTGETLESLAATMKRFGAACVTNIVFARTPQR